MFVDDVIVNQFINFVTFINF